MSAFLYECCWQIVKPAEAACRICLFLTSCAFALVEDQLCYCTYWTAEFYVDFFIYFLLYFCSNLSGVVIPYRLQFLWLHSLDEIEGGCVVWNWDVCRLLAKEREACEARRDPCDTKQVSSCQPRSSSAARVNLDPGWCTQVSFQAFLGMQRMFFQSSQLHIFNL